VIAIVRRWRAPLIAVFVASQLLIPLRYYVAHRDPHDERFAWRMFSPMRMVQCTATFDRDGTSIALGREFHEAWIELASRGRFAVIEAMGAALCARYPSSRIEAHLECTYLEGDRRSFGGYDICNVPEL
jgi:hypothetical protein